MKEIDHDILFLEKLLRDHKISNPVPQEIKSYAKAKKKSQFKKIMKICGQYTLLYGLLTGLYFFLKKTGLGISITKMISSVIITIAVSTSGYYIAKNIDRIKSEENIKELIRIENIATPKPVQRGKIAVRQSSKTLIKKKVRIRRLIGIMPLQSKSVKSAILNRIIGSLSMRLSREKGNDFVRFLSNKKMADLKYAVFNSLERIEGYYFLVVKVVDAETTRIIYNKSRELDSLKDVERELGMMYSEAIGIIERR